MNNPGSPCLEWAGSQKYFEVMIPFGATLRIRPISSMNRFTAASTARARGFNLASVAGPPSPAGTNTLCRAQAIAGYSCDDSIRSDATDSTVTEVRDVQ